MMLTRVSLVALVFGPLVACSAMQSLGEKKDDKKDEGDTAGAEDDDPSDQGDCMLGLTCSPESEDGPKDELTSFGLADFCTYAANDKGEGCFTCTPRELPGTQCVKVPAGFDPAKACQHDNDEMTCDVGQETNFVYDFGEETKDERLYNKIPLLLLGAKALLLGKLDDKPEVKALIFKALDLVDKYKKEMFTDGNLDPMIDEVAAEIKKAKPEIEQARIDEVKAVLKEKAKAIQTKRKEGKLDMAALLGGFTDLLAALPDELVGGLVEQLDLKKISEALSGNGDADIADLITLIGGGKSIEDLLSGLESDDEPSTGSSTDSSTDTGTSTGTDG